MGKKRKDFELQLDHYLYFHPPRGVNALDWKKFGEDFKYIIEQGWFYIGEKQVVIVEDIKVDKKKTKISFRG